MTIAAIENLGTGAHSTSQSSFTMTTVAALEAGNIGILTIVTDNRAESTGETNLHTGVTDGNSNTYTKIREYTYSPGGVAADGVTISIWQVRPSGNLASGSTITMSLATAVVDKCCSMWEFSAGLELEEVGTPQFTGSNINNPPSVSISSLDNNEYLFFRAVGKEVNTTTALTRTSGYTAITGTRSRNNSAAVAVRGEFRILTGTGSTSSPTMNVIADTSTIYIALREYVEPNDPPTVIQDTPDEEVFTTLQPSLLATATDPDGDDVRYQIQIQDIDDFSGVNTGDSYSASGTGIVHPNATGGTNRLGNNQVDDRVGQSFEGGGGLLDKIKVLFGGDADTDGYAVIRVYEHQGTYGTNSEPLNPADPADTPTPDWIAVSDNFPFDSNITTPAEREFTFSGANRIRLEAGVKYVWILDWIPVNTLYDNTIRCSIDSMTLGHAGNAYNDGAAGVNNGPQAGWDVMFTVVEAVNQISATSGTDAGFANEDNGSDSDPFTSGDQVSYTVQMPLDESTTYYWRVRASDPAGSNIWSDWSSVRSFTVSEVASGINAELSVTCENASLSSTGEVAVGGSLDKTLEDSNLSANGSVALTGSLDAVLGDATLEASGTVGSTPITADLVVTCEDAILSADSAVLVSGSLDTALANTSLTADSALLVTGLLDAQLADASLSAAGAALVSASLDAALADSILSADGTLPVTATLDAVLGDTTLEAGGTIGSAAIIADLVVILEDASLNASSAVLVGGEFDMVGADATLTASGTVSVSVALDAQLDGATLESSATVGYAPNGASLSTTFENATLSAESQVLVSAGLAVTLADGGLSANGGVVVAGGLDLVFADGILSSYGIIGDNLGQAVILYAPGRSNVLTARRERVMVAGRRNTRLITQEHHDD